MLRENWKKCANEPNKTLNATTTQREKEKNREMELHDDCYYYERDSGNDTDFISGSTLNVRNGVQTKQAGVSFFSCPVLLLIVFFVFPHKLKLIIKTMTIFSILQLHNVGKKEIYFVS